MGFKWNQDVTQKLMVMTLKLMLFLYFLKIDSGYSGDHCITIIYVFMYFILFCTYVLIKIKQ